MQLKTLLLLFAYAIFVHGKFKEIPKNTTVLQGETVLLKCSLYPAMGYQLSQWEASNGENLGDHEAGILAGFDRRYQYVKENPEELHLLIQNVKVEDEGNFECQMMREGMAKPARASAFVNVLVPPSGIQLIMPNSTQEINYAFVIDDGAWLNITCVGNDAKPEVEIKWFSDGTYFNGATRWNVRHDNKTVTSYAKLDLTIGKHNHNKMLECVVLHKETLTELRTSLKIYVRTPRSKFLKNPVTNVSEVPQISEVVVQRHQEQGPTQNSLLQTNEPAEGPNFFRQVVLIPVIALIGIILAIVVILTILYCFLIYCFCRQQREESEPDLSFNEVGGNANPVKIYGVFREHGSFHSQVSNRSRIDPMYSINEETELPSTNLSRDQESRNLPQTNLSSTVASTNKVIPPFSIPSFPNYDYEDPSV